MNEKFGGLKCECGAELELHVSFDGASEEAQRYDKQHSPKWEWIVSLDCTQCSRTYPVCRTPGDRYISK